MLGPSPELGQKAVLAEMGLSTLSVRVSTPKALGYVCSELTQPCPGHCCNSHVTLNFCTQAQAHHRFVFGLALAKLLAEEGLSKWGNSCLVMQHAARVRVTSTKYQVKFHTFNKIPHGTHFHSISV